MTRNDKDFIPFNRAGLTGGELRAIAKAVAGGHISGNGPFTRRCEGLLEKSLGVGRALLTTSCTHALEMAALLLEIRPGDEVILPSFTFVSTANAFVLRGARPIFCDIRPDTLNLDERRLPSLISRRTKAIVVVHYGGVGCEMDAILPLAEKRGIPVVEDNAHGLFGKYRGRFLGTFGSLAALSFHETKNFTCGEGGALLINDPRHIERAEVLREKGTNRSRFFRGEVDKYTWLDLGSSYIPSDMLAAFLHAQLSKRREIQCRRRRVWNSYHRRLRGWAEENRVRLPAIPGDRQQSFHLFYLILPTAGARDRLIAHLRKRSIHSVFHYLPLHLSAMGKRFGGRRGDCPVTEDLSGRLLRLPFFNDLTEAELRRICDAVVFCPLLL